MTPTRSLHRRIPPLQRIRCVELLWRFPKLKKKLDNIIWIIDKALSIILMHKESWSFTGHEVSSKDNFVRPSVYPYVKPSVRYYSVFWPYDVTSSEVKTQIYLWKTKAREKRKKGSDQMADQWSIISRCAGHPADGGWSVSDGFSFISFIPLLLFPISFLYLFILLFILTPLLLTTDVNVGVPVSEIVTYRDDSQLKNCTACT